MPQIPLTFSTYPHPVPLFAGERRLVNMYAEQAEGPARAEFVLKGAPGMKEFSDVPATITGATGQTCRALFDFDGTTYAIVGQHLVTLASDGTPAEPYAGVPIPGSGPVTPVIDNDECALITNDQDMLLTATSLGQLTGSGIRDALDAMELGGRLVIVPNAPSEPGEIDYSGVGTFTTKAGFFNAGDHPDGALACLRVGSLGVIFGSETTEFFRQTGDATTPFERVAEGVKSIGIAATDSRFAIAGDDFDYGFFLGSSSKSKPSMQMIIGAQARRISTNALESIIGAAGFTYSDCIGWGYAEDGHVFACFHFATEGRCFVYDVTLQSWHERQSGVGLTGAWDARHVHVAHDKILTGAPDGKIYELDHLTHTDRGNPRMALFTADGGASGEFWNTAAQIIFDMTVGEAAAGVTTQPQMMVRFSGDGGKQFSNERSVDLGVSGEYQQQVKLPGLGRYRFGPLIQCRITDSVPREVTKIHGFGRQGRRA